MIGSGIAAATLSPGDTGLQLLENAAATAAGPLHLHPHVRPGLRRRTSTRSSRWSTPPSAALRWRARARLHPRPGRRLHRRRGRRQRDVLPRAISISTHHRASPAHLFAEVVATLGLLLVIFSLARTRRGELAPAAVGAYIGAAYFFTSSTSFANPAIDVGRMFSDTFAGIAPASVPPFVVAQLSGGVLAVRPDLRGASIYAGT